MILAGPSVLACSVYAYLYLMSTHHIIHLLSLSWLCWLKLLLQILIRCKYSLSTHTHTYSQLLKCASCSTSIPFHMRNCTHSNVKPCTYGSTTTLITVELRPMLFNILSCMFYFSHSVPQMDKDPRLC